MCVTHSHDFLLYLRKLLLNYDLNVFQLSSYVLLQIPTLELNLIHTHR